MSHEPITSAAADHLEVMITRAERRRMSLENIARGGEALAKEIVVRFIDGPYHPEPRHEPGRAFANVSRSVRLTLTLEAKTDENIFAMLNGDVSAFNSAPAVCRPRVDSVVAPVSGAARSGDRPDRPDRESERLVDVERPDAPTSAACRATAERIGADLNGPDHRTAPPAPGEAHARPLPEPRTSAGQNPPSEPPENSS